MDRMTSCKDAAPNNPYPAGVPKPGERFDAKGYSFIALGVEQGGLMAITDGPICEKPFDDRGRANWTGSSLRAYLNGEFLEEIGADGLMLQTTDLMTDDGGTEYGTTEDYVSLLTCDLYRKYRRCIPKFDGWWWTATPYSNHPYNGDLERLVLTSGALTYNYANPSYGVVPRLVFNLKSCGARCGDG